MAETQRPDRREHPLAGERATLEAFLDDYRDIVVRKVSGLSDADARRTLVPSPTTVGGLVKHLRWAEYGWFEQLLQGRQRRQPSRARALLGVRASFPRNRCRRCSPNTRRQCDESRRIAAQYPLDHEVSHRRFGDGLAALDLRAHDRGDRPSHRTTRHPARAAGRRRRVRTGRSTECTTWPRDRSLVDVDLAQLALEDFSGRVARQLVEEHHFPRHLVLGQVVTHVVLDGVLVQARRPASSPRRRAAGGPTLCPRRRSRWPPPPRDAR